MRGSIRRWLVVGALASASWVFPGCTNSNRGSDESQNQMGTGGSGGASLEEQGMGGSGGARGTHDKGMTPDSGTPGPTDAGHSGNNVPTGSGGVPTK